MITVLNFMPYGDSKSSGTVYPLRLCAYASNQRPQVLLREWPLAIAVGGRSVATGAAAIDAELAAAVGTPNYVLFNLGANDSDDVLVEATWKTELSYIVDAMHVKWSTALVYLMRPWRRDYGTECDILVGWMTPVIAARAAWCQFGPDERVFLEAGDNGVTYTADGIHPNAAGYALTAQQWLDTLP